MKDMLYAIPDDQITCPPVLVGFGLLQGLVTTLLIRQVTETLTAYSQQKELWIINLIGVQVVRNVEELMLQPQC